MVPVITNAKVFVGTQSSVTEFGVLSGTGATRSMGTFRTTTAQLIEPTP